MIIGVPKEIKKYETRVALIPSGVEGFIKNGHRVLIENNAGLKSGFENQEYIDAGAEILPDAQHVYAAAQMILKVKEPQPAEYPLIKKDQILFTYFHFASSKELTLAMMQSGAVCIAYETVQEKDGSLPLLIPMSEVAGRIAIQHGARYLQAENGGRGVLLGGVPGTQPANVLILGGGASGTNAAKMAAGLGAQVYILDINLDRLRYLSDVMPKNVIPLVSNSHNIRHLLKETDLVVNCILIPGAKTPKLITREMLKSMKKHAVIIDIAIDQGGGLETSRPTDHEHPTYIEEDIIHYCVTNMPSSVPRTSTIALTNATYRYALEIANKGYAIAAQNPAIAKGINIAEGKIRYKEVAATFDLDYTLF